MGSTSAMHQSIFCTYALIYSLSRSLLLVLAIFKEANPYIYKKDDLEEQLHLVQGFCCVQSVTS